MSSEAVFMLALGARASAGSRSGTWGRANDRGMLHVLSLLTAR